MGDRLFKFNVVVETPYRLDNRDLIRKDLEDTLQIAIKQIVIDNLDNLGITGLHVIVDKR